MVTCMTILTSRNALAIFLFLSAVLRAEAQELSPAHKKITLYYTANWELTSPEKAVYHRETNLDFQNLGFEGTYKDYSKANKLLAEGYYEKGVMRGLHSAYNEDGSLKSTYEYSDTGFIIWELVNDKNEHVITRGTGKFTTYFYQFKEQDHAFRIYEGVVSGEFIFGKRTGTWTYEDKAGNLTDQEVYEHGAFAKRITYTRHGAVEYHERVPVISSLAALIQESFSYDTTQYTHLNQYFERNLPAYPESFQRAITFPGGMKRFLLLVAVSLPIQLEETIVKLTVDEHGNFKKIKASLSYGDLDDDLKRIVKAHQLKFLPAIADGKPYELTMRIPISNSQPWITYLQTTTADDLGAYLRDLNE
jgi:antitoxin component YwqK of YwqJK toxin-antitoxin module